MLFIIQAISQTEQAQEDGVQSLIFEGRGMSWEVSVTLENEIKAGHALRHARPSYSETTALPQNTASFTSL